MLRILFIASLIIGLPLQDIFAHSPGDEQLSLELIYETDSFSIEYPKTYTHLNDGKHFVTLLQGTEIVKLQYANIKDTVWLFNAADYQGKINSIVDYQFSGDEKYLLLATDAEYIYRHTYVADYYVYSVEDKVLTSIGEDKLHMAKLSPDGEYVAYVFQNNLYVRELANGNVKQITIDGEVNKIINGMPDWVYEEEFTLKTAFFWSPDSKNIAFYRFDETDVKEYSLTLYNDVYPEIFKYKYPKAGESNSKVDIYTYNLEEDNLNQIPINDTNEYYIPVINWTATGKALCITKLNRRQNKLDLLLHDQVSKTLKNIYTETEEKYHTQITEGYLNFINDKEYIIRSEKDKYRHLYLGNTDKKTLEPITQGNWDIAEFEGYDSKYSCVYYTSHEASVFEKQLYVIKLDGTGKKQLTFEKGTHAIDFSKNYSFFIDSYSASATPLKSFIKDKSGKQVSQLINNRNISLNIENYGFVNREYFQFANREGINLNGYLYKPSHIEENKEYPLFMFVYGGPESQQVVEQWSSMNVWFQYLVQQGYVVACVDNRGTDGRGEEFRKSTYLKLELLEAQDQVDAAKYLGSLSYIDAERVGVFGWSYGGSMALQCLIHGKDIFKTAVSVAPVTDWHYYDNIYTERYMQKPEENVYGYDTTSIVKHATDIQGKLLIVHGTADDNVHPQNTAMLLNELVKENIPFDSEYYTNKNHGIYGGKTRAHLFERITKFIMENL